MGCSLTERWTSRWPFRGRRPPLLRASCNVLGAGSDPPRAVATSEKAASEGGPSEQGGREVSASSSTLRAGGRPLFPPSDPSPQKKSAATTRAGLALGGGAPSPFEKPARGSHRLQPLPRRATGGSTRARLAAAGGAWAQSAAPGVSAGPTRKGRGCPAATELSYAEPGF